MGVQLDGELRQKKEVECSIIGVAGMNGFMHAIYRDFVQEYSSTKT